MKLLQSPWLSGFVGMLLYLGTMVAVWKPTPVTPHTEEPDAPPPAEIVQTNGPSWEYQNPEIEELVTELRKNKELLAQKAAQLEELAARLQSERAELTLVTQKVHEMRLEFDRNITRVHEEETGNLKKLAKTYTTMSVDGASAIFKQLDDSAVVKILMFMKEAESAPILEAMAKPGDTEAKRAAGISERLRLALNDSRQTRRTP